MLETRYYLKLDGIAGECTDRGHENWIELESWKWVGHKPVHDIRFVFKVCKASPQLMQACATGETIWGGTLEGVKKGGGKVFSATLNDIRVAGYRAGLSSAGDALPIDVCELNFARQVGTGSPPGPTYQPRHDWLDVCQAVSTAVGKPARDSEGILSGKGPPHPAM